MNGGRKIETATVDWAGSSPRSILFDDIYFADDGVHEAQHVFLEGNDLAVRFAMATRFTIGELGFGTGLNILAAWRLWLQSPKPPGARLNFMSFEKHPLSEADLKKAHAAWPQFVDLSARLVAAYPARIGGVHHALLAEDVSLTLVFGDAAHSLSKCEAVVDAWFLDGFSPAKNPDMWASGIFKEISRLSAPQATAATFTVAGDVRRGLEAAGFIAEKRKGYGRKREMLTARLASPTPAPSRRQPWFDEADRRQLEPGALVAIIGGGVAGASLAYSLRRTGFTPTIIDPAGIAGGASGNPAGLIMPRLDLGDEAPARFFRSSYLHALHVINALEAECGFSFFSPCGVELRARDDADRERFARMIAADLLPPDMIESCPAGLFFPQAGVIDPRRFCGALTGDSPVIRARAERIESGEHGVRIILDDGYHDADAVVLANGVDALRFVETRTLPLSPIKGQIDWFPHATAPPRAHAFGPYAAPAPDGGLIIGATYEPIATGAEPRASEAATASNIRAIAEALPALASGLGVSSSIPRAAIRCQTPDRLPIAGPIPDWSFFGAAYDDLRLGVRRDYPAGRMAPRRFVLAGLGSRGLVTAPLCAAMIAARLSGAPSPVDYEVAEALHPGRFFIRDLKRSPR